MSKIVTNPGRGSELVNDDKKATNKMRTYLDDITLKLNGNLLGQSVIHPIYKADQTPSELPDAGNNEGGIIFATNVPQEGLSGVPLYAAVDTLAFSIVITNVTNSFGLARFNHAVGDIELGRQVIISGFPTITTYNGTFFTTETGGGFFIIGSIVFDGTEAGGSFVTGNNWRTIRTNAIVV